MLKKILAVLVGGTLLGLGGFQTAGAHEIRIAVVGPMAFVQGTNHWEGAQIAADEINAAGGIKQGGKNHMIELIKVDSNEMLSVPDAANALERALTRDKADFVVGGFRSEAVLAMQEVAMDFKKIFLGCGAAHQKLGERVQEDYDRYKYWFRVTPQKSPDLGKAIFSIFGDVAKKVGAAKGRAPKVAIVAEKALWTQGLMKAAQGVLPKMKMEVVGTWQPSPVATDLTAELSAIRRAGADMLMVIMSGPVGIVLGRQMVEMGIPAVACCTNVEAQKDGWMEATAGKGNFMITQDTYGGGDVAVTAKTIAFAQAFHKRFGHFPTYNAGTHDALNVLKEAIETADSLDADKIVPVLEKTDRIGAGGHLKFDKFHDPVFGPGGVTGIALQWQDGKKVGVWPNDWHGLTYPGIRELVLPPALAGN